MKPCKDYKAHIEKVMMQEMALAGKCKLYTLNNGQTLGGWKLHRVYISFFSYSLYHFTLVYHLFGLSRRQEEACNRQDILLSAELSVQVQITDEPCFYGNRMCDLAAHAA